MADPLPGSMHFIDMAGHGGPEVLKVATGPCGANSLETTNDPVPLATQFAVTVNDWPGRRTLRSMYWDPEVDRQTT